MQYKLSGKIIGAKFCGYTNKKKYEQIQLINKQHKKIQGE